MENRVTADSVASSHQEWKLQAARRALEFVEPGMTLGLGSGSTASLWIQLLGEKVRDQGLKIRAIASSEASEALGRSYGIPFITFADCEYLDLVVDGADEVAPGLALIKGGGGKLLREKIVASAARRFIVVADGSKVVEKLGKFPLPVEVIQMAVPLISRALQQLGFTPTLRLNQDGSHYITDEGNVLLDCSGVLIDDPAVMAAKIANIVGVVEHGLFLNMANLALIADSKQVLERSK
jgi:ribose 5-phosphate isomerase A